MPVTINAADNQFAASSGSNIDVTPNYSYFDHPPNSTANLTITSNMGDDNPYRFDVGETYDLTWTGHGGGIMEDATIIRSDYLSPGEGAIVFEGTNSVTGEPFQMVWTPGFDLEAWYWDSGGGPSSPNAFWTSDQNNSETYEAACYAPGTLIDTPDGQRAVETLKANDLVSTLDNGPQAIRWVHSGDDPLEAVEPGAKPVLIAAGALGRGLPAQDLIVSPQHRMFVGGHGQLDGWFTTESLAPAKSLTAMRGIRHMKGKQSITWIHFACDRHEVVIANGCLSESLLLGPMVVNGLTSLERQELTAIYGIAPTPDAALNGPAARGCLKVGEVRRYLAERKKDNLRRTAKEIRKWDIDLEIEQWEEDLLGVAMANGQKPDLKIAS
ncbi:MAG: Hint domain-containing protein [Sulfitobacter sp.]